MTYYVTFHGEMGGLMGISSFNNFTPPPDYVCEERDGELKDVCGCEWDSNCKKFLEKKLSIVSKLEFLTKFTSEERITARQMASSDPIIDDFFRLLELSEEIDLSHPMVISGLYYLVSINILTESRVNEILG